MKTFLGYGYDSLNHNTFVHYSEETSIFAG